METISMMKTCTLCPPCQAGVIIEVASDNILTIFCLGTYFSNNCKNMIKKKRNRRIWKYRLQQVSHIVSARLFKKDRIEWLRTYQHAAISRAPGIHKLSLI